jgi:hypothetical protein
MKSLTLLLSLTLVLSAGSADKEEGWISLFDGKSLTGWKINEEPATFKVEDGKLVVNGNRGHLFYDGPVQNHDFKNFELKLEIMTFPGSNSGVYIHTKFQDNGWPSKGYEIQVNNSHTDPKRTAGVYAIDDNLEAPAKDEEWFTMTIVVQGKRIITKVNDKVIKDYTEPDDVKRGKAYQGRVLTSGTFAIQGHDPKSKVMYKSIMVKPLP